MNQLILALPQARYSAQEPPALDFILLVDGEPVEAGRAPAAQLPRPKDAALEVVVLVPAHALSWHLVRLPPGVNAQSPRLRAVLEGLLEDQLLDAPADLHLALAEEGRGSSATDDRWVAACERRWLAMALQGLAASGCEPTRVLPEWGPPGPTRVHVTGSAEQPRLLLSSPDSTALLDFSAEVLAWALPTAEARAAHLSAEPELLEQARALCQSEVRPWPRSERWAAAALPRWDLARGLLMRRGGPRSPLEWLRAPRWRSARWATLGLLAAHLIGLNVLAWSQQAQLQLRQDQMRQALLHTFPRAQAGTVDDPAQQMQRELERLRAASAQPTHADLPVMLSAVLPALPPGRVPQALDYTPGQLRLEGLALSAAELQAVAGRLGPQGYSAQAQGPMLSVRARP
jgi:general secretion pathway protein L